MGEDTYGTVGQNLVALNHPEMGSGFLAVQIKTPDRIYTAELRHKSGWDRGFPRPPEVIIHEQRSPDYYASSGHGPFDNINLLAELHVNEKWEDTSRNLSFYVDSITPDGKEAYLTVKKLQY